VTCFHLLCRNFGNELCILGKYGNSSLTQSMYDIWRFMLKFSEMHVSVYSTHSRVNWLYHHITKME
jgi:hypothetical protein